MNNWLISILAVLLLSGCCVYNPQVTDIPLINGKNDFRIDAGIAVLPSVNATVSYGLTEKMAIQAFGSLGPDHNAYLQIAPGVYKLFGNNTVMELYGGFGHGHGDAYRDANPGNLVGNYQVYFIQYNFGQININNSRNDFGLGIKTGYFHSDLTDENYYDIYPENVPFPRNIENSILIEPSMVARFGGKHFKFSFKAGACWILKITDPDRYIPTQVINIGLGINYSLNDLTRGK